VAPARSTKPLTSPKEFRLRTETRRKRSHSMLTRSTESLGGYSSASDSGRESEGEYIPLAERLKKFAVVPDRFHSKPRSADRPTRLPRDKPTLTEPKAPRLLSETRTRTRHVRSRRSLEEEEVEKLKEHKFHARPLDRRVLESHGDLGVPRVPKATITEPVPFAFHVDARATSRPRSCEPSPARKFHARPAPNFEKVAAPKPVPKPELTQPSPFVLSTDARAMISRPSSREPSPERKFHAKPAPNFERVAAAPKPEPKPLTEPEPFQLSSVARAEMAAECFRQRMEKEMVEERERFSSFKARPVPADKPFTPRKETLPLTEVSPFKLNVDRRKEDRNEFETRKLAKEAAQAAERREQQRDKEEREAMELAQLRKSMVPRVCPAAHTHHTVSQANPIKHYPSVDPKRSAIALTEPRSPKLRTEMRMRGLRS